MTVFLAFFWCRDSFVSLCLYFIVGTGSRWEPVPTWLASPTILVQFWLRVFILRVGFPGFHFGADPAPGLNFGAITAQDFHFDAIVRYSTGSRLSFLCGFGYGLSFGSSSG